jgi:diguanylate cyclase (GGDEF)-like protein
MCNSHVLARVRYESRLDLLSGAFNRQGIEQKLAVELKRIERSSSHKLCIALIDIDHFKAINDTSGHAAGDAALRNVAAAVADGLRAYDYLGRYGGDEFLLILPQTACDDALTVSDRIGRSVRSTSRSTSPITVSIGLTEAIPGEAATTLLARADKALYEAKSAGRNCSRSLLHNQFLPSA